MTFDQRQGGGAFGIADVQDQLHRSHVTAKGLPVNAMTAPLATSVLPDRRYPRDEVQWTPAERDAWLEMAASAVFFLRLVREEGRYGATP